jgi:hypothetical protein
MQSPYNPTRQVRHVAGMEASSRAINLSQDRAQLQTLVDT